MQTGLTEADGTPPQSATSHSSYQSSVTTLNQASKSLPSIRDANSAQSGGDSGKRKDKVRRQEVAFNKTAVLPPIMSNDTPQSLEPTQGW